MNASSEFQCLIRVSERVTPSQDRALSRVRRVLEISACTTLLKVRLWRYMRLLFGVIAGTLIAAVAVVWILLRRIPHDVDIWSETRE